MSAKERERLKIFARVKRGSCSRRRRPQICGLDYRYRGDSTNDIASKAIAGWCIRAVVDPRTERYPAEFRAAVLARYQERYPDFGPTLAAEKLALDGYGSGP